MIFLIIAAAILYAGALADGITTNNGIKTGNVVESNKLLDFIFRTNTPSALQIFGGGAAITTFEIAASAWLTHVGFLPWLWPYMLIGQALAHGYFAYKNTKLY